MTSSASATSVTFAVDQQEGRVVPQGGPAFAVTGGRSSKRAARHPAQVPMSLP